MAAAPTTLPETLRQARKARRLSQLELSLRVGVSQRHMSFVESGRANPSRELLLAWLQELEAPLAVRNAALLQAGRRPTAPLPWRTLRWPRPMLPCRRCCTRMTRCPHCCSTPTGTCSQVVLALQASDNAAAT